MLGLTGIGGAAGAASRGSGPRGVDVGAESVRKIADLTIGASDAAHNSLRDETMTDLVDLLVGFDAGEPT